MMHSGRPRRLGKIGILLGLAVASGCAGDGGRLSKALIADRQPATHARDLESHYRVHCADVLRVEVRGAPESSGVCKVALDGRIALAEHRVEVEGRPTGRIAALVAREVGAREADVVVSVKEYNSQRLYLFGEIAAKYQTLPYRGPETVVDLLRRVGGGTQGAALADVRVVRSHVADGLPPEVFHVDLEAILVKNDLQTNIRLEPSDHIHIGQSRRSKVACQLPPWLRELCGGRKKAQALEDAGAAPSQ
jgi:protein involved in polysaccharide export with SLBB domain